MPRFRLRLLSASLALFAAGAICAGETPATRPAGVADPKTYLAAFCQAAQVKWPKNHTLNVIFHGHSVPAGYAKTPEVRPLDAYPNQLRVALAERFPFAVINIITTAIGGENAEKGAARFERDVLTLRPDVVLIDYALNDRGIRRSGRRPLGRR